MGEGGTGGGGTLNGARAGKAAEGSEDWSLTIATSREHFVDNERINASVLASASSLRDCTRLPPHLPKSGRGVTLNSHADLFILAHVSGPM